jgi:uncharacterized membrane protein
MQSRRDEDVAVRHGRIRTESAVAKAEPEYDQDSHSKFCSPHPHGRAPMTSSHHLRKKTLGLAVLMVICSASGDLLLKKGMAEIGSVHLNGHALATTFLRTATSGTIWEAIACLLGAFVIYMMLLSWADYSYVLPANSLGYAVVALFGVILLGEHVTMTRWAGIALICSGVALVGQTEPRTTKKQIRGSP